MTQFGVRPRLKTPTTFKASVPQTLEQMQKMAEAENKAYREQVNATQHDSRAAKPKPKREGGIDPLSQRVLLFIGRNPGCDINQIKKSLGVGKSTIRTRCDWLEAEGEIDTRYSNDDKPKRHVFNRRVEK